MSENEKTMTAEQTTEKEAGFPPFDREEWIEQKKAEREHAYELIDEAAEVMKTSGERLQNYLDLQSRFPKYSAGNILLISIQKPDATRIGDFESWKEIGAVIRKGETGIMILEPGREFTRGDGRQGVSYNTKRVFDVSQTTFKGPKVPPVKKDDRLLLKALVYNAPCEISIDDSVRFPENMSARYDPKDRIVYVARDRDASVLFREIAREIAHAFMAGDDYDRDKTGFTAECASYIVLKRYNADVTGFSFEKLPESFTALDPRGVRNELSTMRDLANAIASGMERFFEQEREERTGKSGREDGEGRKNGQGAAERA